MASDFDKVIPTAWAVAKYRSFSDIPFAKDVFDELSKILSARNLDTADSVLDITRSPQFEARYKLTDRLASQYGSSRVLEVAAGFSGRGLAMSRNPAITYVELDLAGVIEEKRRILASIAKQSGFVLPQRLYLESGSALDPEAFARAVSHLGEGPVTVINEGLMRYLSFPEKTQYACNVRDLLEARGGVWITPDITLKAMLQAESTYKNLVRTTGVDIDKNRFEDETEARSFFESLGFSVERHSLLEMMPELVSPRTLGMDEDAVLEAIGPAVEFVMRVKTS